MVDEGRTVGPKTTMASVREEPEEKKKKLWLDNVLESEYHMLWHLSEEKKKASENYKYK